MTEDRELQKQIAEDAQLPGAETASPLVRAFQLFLVPLLIVGACVLFYVTLNYVVANPRTPREWLKDVKEGGLHTRPHASLQFSQALRRMEQPDTTLTPEVIAVYKTLGPQDDPVRCYLITCLGYLRDPRACELLLEIQKTAKSLEMRALALDALGTIKDPSTLPELVKLLDDSEGLVRKYAVFNAAAVAEKADAESRAAAAGAIRKKLADPVADVTWNAAFALAYFLNDRSGTDLLKKMLDRKYLAEAIRQDDGAADDLRARVIMLACQAAVKIKDESFVPLLKPLADLDQERRFEVRQMAHRAISKIQEK